MAFDPGNRLIVALDVPDRDRATELVDALDGAASWLKIGLELFTAEGPSIVKSYTDKGSRVMLDLKLHDIPATVRRATQRVVGLGAGLLTIHASGGRAMMEAAVAATREGSEDDVTRMRILAVTVLTSLEAEDLVDVGYDGDVSLLVQRRAQLAIDSGCDGVVASPAEAELIREIAPEGFLIVTPGIRPVGVEADDQKRVTTAVRARELGADMVVVGRAIRDAADPAAAARAIVADLS